MFGRLCLRGFVGLLLFSTALWGQAAQPSLQDLLNKAVKLHQAGNLEAAAPAYEAFLARYKESADIYSNLGAVYAGLGRLPDAVKQYEKALTLGNSSNPAGVRFNLAVAHYKSARLDLASSELEQVMKAEPKNVKAALLLGDCYFRGGEMQKVIDLLEPLEPELNENQAWIYLYASALLRTDRAREGERLIDRILRKGDSAEAHILLGTAHLMVRDYPGASTEFAKALELNDQLPGANALYAGTLESMSRHDEAIGYYRKELEVNPIDFDSLLYLGAHVYKQEQNYEEALGYFDRALKIRPGNLETRFQIAMVKLLQEDLETSLRMVEEIVVEAPEFLEAHVSLTRLYYRLGRREEAAKHRRIVEEIRKKRDAETLKSMERSSDAPG